jgi:mRNA interferase MazF
VIRGARPIYLADLDKQRPCVLLTRQYMAGRFAWVTIAPITSQIRGIPTEVKVDAGPETGLKLDSVISGDNIRTIPKSALVRQIGMLPARCEQPLTAVQPQAPVASVARASSEAA